MKIFISWSQNRSQYVAKALRDWLPLVLHYTEPWLSDRDIGAGNRWSDAIAKELEARHFGILILTHENINAPWVLFEAGALSKTMAASVVVPYLVGLDFKDLTGPLAQFHSKKADRASTRELIDDINTHAGKPVSPSRVAELFDALWPKLDAVLSSVPPSDVLDAELPQERDVIEDLVKVTRRLERRIDDLADTFGRTTKARPAVMPQVQTLTIAVSGHFAKLGGISEIEISPQADVVAHIAGIAGVKAKEFGNKWFVRERRGGRLLTRVELQNYTTIGSATQLVELTDADPDDEDAIGSPS